MGSPMAGNLAKAGHEVDRLQPARRQRGALAAAGGRAAGSIAEAVADADVVCVMVPDSPDVQRRPRPARAASSTAPSPARSSSTSPASAPTSPSSWPAQAEERGFRVLDAPVSGGEAGAVDAALSIMVGGDAEDFAGRPPAASTPSARPSSTSARTAPARPSRPPTSSSSPPTSRRSPRRSSSSRRTASTPRPRSRCSAAGWPAPRCSTRRSENMLVPLVRARLPDRPAPQGHGHRHRRRPRGRCRRARSAPWSPS